MNLFTQPSIDNLIFVTGILLLLGIASNKFSARLGVPVLFVFLMVGMLAGSEGIGGIEFEDYSLANGIGTVALCVILLDGGIRTSYSSIRSAWKPAGVLATVGVFITAILTGLAASWILDLTILQGLLLGSIIAASSALTAAMVLPLSALVTFTMMNQLGMSANRMSLGGLVIAIGMLVVPTWKRSMAASTPGTK